MSHGSRGPLRHHVAPEAEGRHLPSTQVRSGWPWRPLTTRAVIWMWLYCPPVLATGASDVRHAVRGWGLHGRPAGKARQPPPGARHPCTWALLD